MSIDKSGKWWVGTVPHDIDEYLQAYSADSYKTSQFRLAKCTCGSEIFHLFADDEEGCVQRKCTSCGKEIFICDSDEYWEDASPEEWKCECGSTNANVGVGFSVYEDGEIRWLYVGERCATCGTLGCFAGWKIGYSPSTQLFDLV